jgi:high-affinity nickel-transport protein
MPNDFPGLVALVLSLGVRHGFDPDHLVAIDGLARASARSKPRLARRAGLWFSLGHGAIVTLVGLAVALFARGWEAPAWLAPLGAAISIAVLTMLGVANVFLSVKSSPDVVVRPIGFRGRWVGKRVLEASHPAVIAAIGAAFALSFDTVSHAVLFSASGAAAAGWRVALLLGLVFTLGMVLTDALNGWWVARMVLKADRKAASASRWMSAAIGGLCLAIAASGLARLGLPQLDAQLSAFAPVVGVATILLVALAYVKTATR